MVGGVRAEPLIASEYGGEYTQEEQADDLLFTSKFLQACEGKVSTFTNLFKDSWIIMNYVFVTFANLEPPYQLIANIVYLSVVLHKPDYFQLQAFSCKDWESMILKPVDSLHLARPNIFYWNFPWILISLVDIHKSVLYKKQIIDYSIISIERFYCGSFLLQGFLRRCAR